VRLEFASLDKEGWKGIVDGSEGQQRTILVPPFTLQKKRDGGGGGSKKEIGSREKGGRRGT